MSCMTTSPTTAADNTLCCTALAPCLSPVSLCVQCPNEFVVGYGLDFDECYRCLPYVAALKEEAYAGSGH